MNDDNEEVFRRAAENYPLRTDKPDWEPVLKKLQAQAGSNNRQAVKKRSYRSLLLLLLLLPVAAIFIKYQRFLNGNDKNIESENVAAAVPALQSQEKSIDLSGIHQTGSQAETVTGNSAALTPVYDDKAITEVYQQNKSSDHVNKITTGKTISVYSRRSSFSLNQRGNINISNEQATGEDHADVLVTEENKLPVAVAGIDKKIATVVAGIAEANEKPAEKDLLPKITTSTEKETAKRTTKNEKKNKQRTKHFYAGLLVGPDFSTVKLYSVKRTGFSLGITGGYRIKNRLSIETGLLWDKKLYSSNGEYFSTKNISLPMHSEIEYVSGKCNMLELPLNVVYTFGKKKKAGWFGAAGISSYFMKKESYVFDVKRYGAEYPYAAEYKKHDNQVFAVVNLSVGYMYSLGKLGELRIQPYVKLPVQKIGTGEFHLQSGGILVGFTKNIF